VEVVSWGWTPDGAFDGRLALRRAEALEERLRAAADDPDGDGAPPDRGGAERARPERAVPPAPPRLSLDRAGHAAAVAAVREAIAQGECYQADLTVRFDVPCALPAADLFERLLAENPAPYSACIETDEGAVVSSSPERLLAVRDRAVATGPIKGTIARPSDPAADPAADRAAAAALLASAKDRAELLMITDLLRNDLGKVCRPGTVRCPRLREVESFAHVHHLVSTVVGELPAGRDALDALVAVFPGGSVAGAPKRRAMEWLARLETAPRGPYTGTVGWTGFDGSAEWNVAIRTGRLADGTLGFGAGGGIVWDSTPDDEWRELHWKARAFLRAVGAAEDAAVADPGTAAAVAATAAAGPGEDGE
jgi:para-aminobenzoate synthetase component 1